MSYLVLLAIGLVAGVASGMFGIGGGLIIVPALLYMMKLKELEAIGTSLAALIPPVGLLGAIVHYRAGNIRVSYAVLLAAGLFVGAYFGAKIITPLDPRTIQRIYGIFLLLIAARMLIMGK